MSTKLERLLRMDGIICSGGYPSVKTFMERFEMSARTVHYDLQFLKDRFSAPIDYSSIRRGYFYREQGWQFPTLPVSEGQLLALFLSVELTERYLGTRFEQPLREAIQHIAEMLPHDVQVSMSALAQHYSIRSVATATTAPETLMELQKAMQYRYPVDMTYFTASRGEETQRTIHPYHLINIRGEWYVIAYDLFRQGIRQFSLPRIRTLSLLTEERFTVNENFSPEGYFRESFQAEHGEDVVDVVLLFDAYQARYIRERTLHVSQSIVDNADGSIVVHFTTGALSEVQRQVLSYGQHVKVLAPLKLINAIIEEAQAITRLYETLFFIS